MFLSSNNSSKLHFLIVRFINCKLVFYSKTNRSYNKGYSIDRLSFKNSKRIWCREWVKTSLNNCVYLVCVT